MPLPGGVEFEVKPSGLRTGSELMGFHDNSSNTRSMDVSDIHAGDWRLGC